jgi:hypothetical protein
MHLVCLRIVSNVSYWPAWCTIYTYIREVKEYMHHAPCTMHHAPCVFAYSKQC